MGPRTLTISSASVHENVPLLSSIALARSTCILLAGLLAMALVQIATLQGVGITSDSAIYIDAARQLARGEGFVQSSPVGAPIPVTHYPPGYPALLCLVMMLCGADAPEAARWLGTIVIGVNVLLAGDLANRHSKHAWAGPLAALLCAVSLHQLRVHATAWSEAPFLTLCLLCLRAFSAYLVFPTWRNLFVACSLAAGATLTRYVGVTLVISGVAGVLLLQQSYWKQRVRNAGCFAILASTPFAAWCGRNWYLRDSMVNRGFSPLPLTIDEWNVAARTLAEWFCPFANGATTQGTIAACLLAGIAVVLILHARTNSRRSPLPQLIELFIACYILFVLASIALVDHTTPIDWRILIPVFACGVVLHLCVASDLLQHRSRQWQIAYLVVASILVASHAAHSTPWLITASWDDKGFNSPAWQNSRLLDYLRREHPDAVIFSNAGAAIRFHSQRGTYSIPNSLLEKTTDEQAVQRLRDRLAARHGLLVIARVRPLHVSGEDSLARQLGVTAIFRSADGTVYRLDDSHQAGD